ncbi:MAG TPA: hypothetical protein VHH88_07575 [Verrucomicrobiae bacterium]|nr:hypothetical protein [Verrucomicrobiae bacterium]
MSARKIGGTEAGTVNQTQRITPELNHVVLQGRQERLSLSAQSIVMHKNGIEFRSAASFTPWTEMTLTIQSSANSSRVHCNGVVISCTGNRHTGYHVSMVFTGLSRQAQARIAAWSASR